MNAPAFPPQGQPDKFGQVIKLLRNDKLRTFRVSIETDSTRGVDRDQEKQSRTELLMAAAQYLQNAAGVGENVPELIPLLANLLMFGVRGFGIGRNMEIEFERALQALEDKAVKAQGQPPPPDPAIQAAQIQAQSAEKADHLKLQMAQMRAQNEIEINKMKLQAQQQADTIEAQIKKFEAMLQARVDERGQDKVLEGVLAGAHARSIEKEQGQKVELRGQDIEAAAAERNLQAGLIGNTKESSNG